MVEHILVRKNVEYLVEELNLCQHLWAYRTHNPQALMNYVVQYGYAKHCDQLSVISMSKNSITIHS